MNLQMGFVCALAKMAATFVLTWLVSRTPYGQAVQPKTPPPPPPSITAAGLSVLTPAAAHSCGCPAAVRKYWFYSTVGENVVCASYAFYCMLLGV